MVFSSYLFLFVFLPVFFCLYFVTPNSYKNFCVLVASYLFYCWGAPTIVFLLLASSVADYLLSHAINRRAEHSSARFWLLILSLAINLCALGYFKYANFFITEFNSLLTILSIKNLLWTEVVLPIGISFFTFQKMSYLIDVYRNTVPPAKTFANYALYVALFPQLIAGPIIRYHDINQQIEKRTHDLDSILYGIYRFSRGLAKKVIIADAMGAVANNIFALPEGALTTSYAWLGALAYAYQIYFDFSGYSDMALGLGRIMGFHFLENFNMPYISQTITEFWRRWHISLSNWMREYLYIPLGGNKGTSYQTYRNLWIVFLLSGLWHGASWNFVVWGIFHGLFLSLDKVFWLKISLQLPKIVNIAITFTLVIISWVIFRCETLSAATSYLIQMIPFYSTDPLLAVAPRATLIHNRGLAMLIIATALCFGPLLIDIEKVKENLRTSTPRLVIHSARFAGSFACLILSALTLATTNFNPFIYFRF